MTTLIELKQKINEFDIFQQSIKSQITLAKPVTLDYLQENLLNHQAYIRILNFAVIMMSITHSLQQIMN